jgi:putative selenate reductase molybdopterin-binding subunit
LGDGPAGLSAAWLQLTALSARAVANALANATGVSFAHLPFTPDRIFDKLGVAT